MKGSRATPGHKPPLEPVENLADERPVFAILTILRTSIAIWLNSSAAMSKFAVTHGYSPVADNVTFCIGFGIAKRAENRGPFLAFFKVRSDGATNLKLRDEIESPGE